MSHGFALWKNDSSDLGWGALTLASDGNLGLRTPDGTADVRLDLSTSPFVDAYAAPRWFCAVGSAASQLVMGHAEGPRVGVIAELERLDRGGRYDSGVHALRFHDRPDHDQCVLAWEIGVALLDPAVGTVWTHVHHDVSQRLVRITSENVELMGERDAISVSLGDGAARQRSYGGTTTGTSVEGKHLL
jgi:hypothetical protein